MELPTGGEGNGEAPDFATKLDPRPHPALERAVRWLCETTGDDVQLDYLTWNPNHPDVLRARCKVGDGSWTWTDVPAEAVRRP